MSALDRGLWQDAVSKIENMSGTLTSPCENIFNSPVNFLNRSIQNHRVEVSLYRYVIPKTRPRFIQLNVPV